MNISSILRLALAIVVAGALGSAVAQDKPQDKPQEKPAHAAQHEGGRGVLRLLPADAVSDHSIDTVRWARSPTRRPPGTLPFYDQSGEQSAAVFYTAYVAKNFRTTNRPLTFVFNGGPGAASAFLHLGLVGPRILDLGAGRPRRGDRAELRDNPDTWLEFHRPGSDRSNRHRLEPYGQNGGWQAFLGHPRPTPIRSPKRSRSTSPKTTERPRRNICSAKAMAGFRAAKVARALQHDQGIVISGIVMLSPMLEGWLTFGDDKSALRAALQLPSLAAAELERKNNFTRAALADAETFAMTDYLVTMAGAPPQGAAGKAFYQRVAQISTNCERPRIGEGSCEFGSVGGFAAHCYSNGVREIVEDNINGGVLYVVTERDSLNPYSIAGRLFYGHSTLSNTRGE